MLFEIRIIALRYESSISMNIMMISCECFITVVNYSSPVGKKNNSHRQH